MSRSVPPSKRKNSPEKTPATILQELCMQQQEFAVFDFAPDTNDSHAFCCTVTAFQSSADGSGRTKKEAKHVACANLIAELKKSQRFEQNLQTVQAKRSTFESDAVGTLLDICVQREWPLAKFDVMEAYGEPHLPQFTVICQLASIKRTGTSSRIRDAKQIAARQMLELVQNFHQNEEKMQVATVQSEPPEKVFRRYYELKAEGIKPTVVRLRSRHNFLMRLPEDHRNEATQILFDNSGIYGSNQDKVELVCNALKIRYHIQDVPDHPLSFKLFFLRDNIDCVFTGKEPDLYDRIVDYFKTMLNLQTY